MPKAQSRWLALLAILAVTALTVARAAAQGAGAGGGNLVSNSNFQTRGTSGGGGAGGVEGPAGYELRGDVQYRYLGDPARDMTDWGVALQSAASFHGDTQPAGSVAQTVRGINAKNGRWYRFTFRGLPQDNFSVTDDDLYMKVEFFGNAGRTAMDAKAKQLYGQVEQARHDLGVNGDRHRGGAAAWQTYQLDFWLPFPQVDQVRLSVGFGHGAARNLSTAAPGPGPGPGPAPGSDGNADNPGGFGPRGPNGRQGGRGGRPMGRPYAPVTAGTEFFVTDFSLVKIDAPEPGTPAKPGPDTPDASGGGGGGGAGAGGANSSAQPSIKTLIPLGGRWFYKPRTAETSVPRSFDFTNADRLLYNDGQFTAPFAGEMTAWLRAGDKDIEGNLVRIDRLITDNVTVSFDATSLVIHTKGLPNHPTGKYPETGFGPGGRGGNPSYIQEQRATYYIPLNPQENPNHVVTTTDNSNHALPMGPIGIAVNGVVFFNPFDMGNQDASDLMDRCCGHPNQDNLYHYHKYPICLNSPWADEGKEHSPLIGFAFDGYPIYGPYASAGVLAKDVTGPYALNAFNMHYDQARGWHYQVTPGKFPYIIGGYWGTEDPRDRQRPHGRMGFNGPGGQGGQGNNPGGMGNGPPGMGGGPPGIDDQGSGGGSPDNASGGPPGPPGGRRGGRRGPPPGSGGGSDGPPAGPPPGDG